jgi:hypothetical protein
MYCIHVAPSNFGMGGRTCQSPRWPHLRQRGLHSVMRRFPRPFLTSIAKSQDAQRRQPGHQQAKVYRCSRISRKVLTEIGWGMAQFHAAAGSGHDHATVNPRTLRLAQVRSTRPLDEAGRHAGYQSGR